MFKRYSVLAFIKSLMLHAVDDDAVGEVETASVVEEQPDLHEAVLNDIGLGDDDNGNEAEAQAAEQDQGNQGEQDGLQEQKPEQEQELQQKPEEVAKKDLSDEDLKPLESKNAKTNERFQKVTEGYKQKAAEVEQLNGRIRQYESSFESLKSLGFNDEAAAQDLVNFSDYRKAIYSGDAERFQSIIADQIRQFEAAHGKRVQINASLLDTQEDLKKRVESLDLDEQTAFELARSRQLQERAQRQQLASMENVQRQQQFEQMVNQSVSTIDQMQQNWSKSDPDFQAILPYLQKHIDDIGKTYPPHMWPQVVDMQYKTLKTALSDQRRQVQKVDQPLRGNGGNGSVPVPQNTQEAVLQAMGLV